MNKITGKPLDALQDHKQRYGLRKFSFGLASVLLGSSWLMMQNGPVAHADVAPVNKPTKISNQTAASQPYQANAQADSSATSASQPAVSQAVTATPVAQANRNVKVISKANQTSGTYVQAANTANAANSNAVANNTNTVADSSIVNQASTAANDSLVDNSAATSPSTLSENSHHATFIANLAASNATSSADSKPEQPKTGTVAFDIYDDTTHQTIGTIYRSGNQGSSVFVDSWDVATKIGHPYSSFTGGFGHALIDDSWNFSTIHIQHVVEDIKRSVAIDWTINPSIDWSGRVDVLPGLSGTDMPVKHKMISGTLAGKKDLFTNEVEYDKKVSGLNASSLSQSISMPMGAYISSYSGDGNVHVNPFAPGTTSSMVVGRVYLDPAYLTEKRLASEATNFNDEQAPIKLRLITNVECARMTVPIEIKYHFINPITKKAEYLPSDYVVGKYGDRIAIQYKQIPSFKFVNEKSLIKMVDLTHLTAHTDRHGRLVFNTPKIDVALQVVPQVNYRYYDLLDEHNKALTMRALMPNWSPQKQNGSATDKWDKSVEGKKNVKSALESLTYLDNIGTDGKANGDKRTDQIKQLLLEGYDVRGTDGKAWSDIGRARSAAGLAQSSQVYTINDVVWSNAKFKKELRKATDKNLVDTINKIIQQYKNQVNGAVDQMNAAMKALNQAMKRGKSHANNNYADSAGIVSAVNNVNQTIQSTGDRLSQIKIADSMKSTLKPVRVTQGFIHLYDYFSKPDKHNPSKDKPRIATPGTKLLSGKTVGQLSLSSNGDFDPNDIYNPSSYGNYHDDTLIIKMKKNANGVYWPPESSNGPITGFGVRQGNSDFNFSSVTGENHLGDPAYAPVYQAWQQQFERQITLGHGAEYMIDDVTGEVTRTLYGLQDGTQVWQNNPVYYFPLYEGYDLYVNGQKVDDTNTNKHSYYMLNSDIYLPVMNADDEATYEFEYRPETAKINIKIADQNGNVLEDKSANGNVDSVVFMNGIDYGTQFIDSYNQNHQDKYMEYVATDVPYNLAIQPKDHGKTFSYTYQVKIFNLVWKNTDNTDANERTVYFNNVNDPTNSHAAITQTVGFKLQREYYDDGHGETFDTGVIKYLPQGSFDDLRGQISNILGTSDWQAQSGSQYLGSYTPVYPGGVSITINYNGSQPTVPDPGDLQPGDNPDDPGLSDNNKHPFDSTKPGDNNDEFPDDPSDNN